MSNVSMLDIFEWTTAHIFCECLYKNFMNVWKLKCLVWGCSSTDLELDSILSETVHPLLLFVHRSNVANKFIIFIFVYCFYIIYIIAATPSCISIKICKKTTQHSHFEFVGICTSLHLLLFTVILPLSKQGWVSWERIKRG